MPNAFISLRPSSSRTSRACWYERDQAAVVEVTDSGPGIAPEQQARVFERFYRVDPSRSVERGAGLGLSIAQWAVAANGGRIELASGVGRGSTFRIVLPRVPEARHTPERELRSGSSRPQT